MRSFLYIIGGSAGEYGGGDIAIEVGLELLNSETEDITDEEITENIKERIKDKNIDYEPDDNEILKLNSVRKTLYKLYSAKLAQFRRIRDKSTGWFIYYWWHEFDLLGEIILEKKKIIQLKLRERLNFEKKNYFFSCKNCIHLSIKYDFDEAFELNFRCPDCGGPLEAQDNQKIIQFLKEKIVLNKQTKIPIELKN
ncbi:MAG: transcription factor E [Promethearchaeota archaeon]